MRNLFALNALYAAGFGDLGRVGVSAMLSPV